MAGKTKLKQPVAKGVAKVPVIMQLEALECGAACLAMVLAYYGKWLPLEEVRRDCGVSRDGSNAGNIMEAAEGYGMEVEGYRMEPETLREEGTFPCIIHWNFNHFVVCDGFRGKKVYLNDPARGNYAVPLETFDECFTGIVLTMKPGEKFVPGGKPKSVWDFARKRLEGAHTALLFVALTTVISSLVGILSSGFSRVFLDKMLTGKEPGWYVPFLAGMSAIAVISLVTAWIQAIYSLALNGKMAVTGSSAFMWKVMRLPMEFFTQRMAGDIQTRQRSNASIAGRLVDTIGPLVLDTLMMVFYLAVMLRYSWLLTLIGVASVLLQLLVSNIISKKRVNITRVMMRDSSKLSAVTTSAMEMIESIKASGSENGYFENWAGYQASVNTQNNHYTELNQYLGLVPKALSALANTAILVLGVWLTMRGEFTVGMVMAFQGFLSSFMSPAYSLIGAGQTIQEMRTDMERVEDVMEYPDDVMLEKLSAPPEEKKEYKRLSGRLEMRNVTFGYNPMQRPLIENFNLTVEPGQRIAFVGTSGCGKSTLSKLISGLYQPWSGEILFDGIPIQELDREVFTSSLGVVDQDIILFEDSISGNIRMWDDTIEDYEVILAARDAQIHNEILKREGGYEYQVTEGGKDFSGGERQRLEIARVLAQNPTILILDEATSALDAQTEYDVVRSINDRGTTCLVIAHRLSTIRDSDEIIVMDQGKVVERGTHQQLMEMNGIYRALIASD